MDTFNRLLNNTLMMTGTAYDKHGKEFVATVEHRRYPFFGTQYHPEKNQFERSREMAVLKRDKLTMQFHRDYVMQAVEMARPFSRELGDVPVWVKSFFASNFRSEKYPHQYFEDIVKVHNQVFDYYTVAGEERVKVEEE